MHVMPCFFTCESSRMSGNHHVFCGHVMTLFGTSGEGDGNSIEDM